MTAIGHIPVMASEVVAAIAPKPGGRYVDATFGRGGYTRALLASAPCRVLALDCDPAAEDAAAAFGRNCGDRFRFRRARFSEMEGIAVDEAFAPADGVAFDLGVSSGQLDDPARGFSFAPGPLDMRMSGAGPSAADLVAGLEEDRLAALIRRYGEEPRARRVARAIALARSETPILTTDRLAAIVARAAPTDGRLHPATRTFQALRIAVNDELGELDCGLAAAERLLAPGGRLAVVSFHSLEDRAVKSFLRARSGDAPAGSRHRPPASPPQPASFRLLHRRAARPGADEIAANPRARSARMRAAERLAA